MNTDASPEDSTVVKRKSTYIGFSTLDGGNTFADNAQVFEVKKIIDNCQP
ncbi:hypothetical protein IQ238_21010 [Pleurocapsales cyanobacterium LEGE 06147]|nr:hypothetical protein [Pleurocapsales cyanobacterium LEGE 06147]